MNLVYIVKSFIFLLLFTCFHQLLLAQTKPMILFDNTHGETSGNSGDWTIDADAWNIAFSSSTGLPYTSGSGVHSNPQRIPTPYTNITASTPESYWKGCLSYWGLDCVRRGDSVESLPAISGKITFGDNTNAQDLSKYRVFVVCEPNIPFSDAEKTAILNFVNNGGGLYMISDHTGSDRNNDGWDSPRIWDNLIDTNSVRVNPFGIHFDQKTISGTYSVVAPLPANDTLLHGPMGNVTRVQWSSGTTQTISTAANPTVKAVIYTNGSSNTGSTNVLCSYARMGRGKVVAMGDSSPFDDGTGDTNNSNGSYFNGYTGDALVISGTDTNFNHRNLIMNSTIWLTNKDPYTYVFTGTGNWNVASNWKDNLIPPATLLSGDSIVINHAAGGVCTLNVTQHIANGASITVLTGKNLVIPGVLVQD